MGEFFKKNIKNNEKKRKNLLTNEMESCIIGYISSPRPQNIGGLQAK